ncbi:MAG: tetratricopeptide repeat protein [Ktedonobacteraceae bacterium]|nr:tetratricopeptide repeat protein [Ktedonobacteraceae bacterium]
MSAPDPDEAFAQVAKEIRAVVESFKKPSPATSLPTGPRKNIPYERNPLFIGRDALLQELHDALQANNQSSATVALSGLGGMGKTQTATEYAYRYQNDYDTLLWLRADSAETLLADFFAAAQLLNLPAQNEQDQSLVISAVKRWLQNNPRWLLIFDNADDLAVLENILPMQHQGHILITTQSQQTGRMARRVSIEDMEPEQAMLFLLRRAGRIGPDDMSTTASLSDQKLAQEIVSLLDSLPLALDQAGAYIDETQCGLDGYVALFKTRQDYLLQHRGKWVKDHPIPVATIWSLAFKRVQEVNSAAADLLRLCAFLDPDSIPEAMIVESESVLPTSLKVLAKDPIKFNEASRDLLNYSLIRRNPDHTFTLHRLVQLALRNEMDTKTQQRWAARAVQVVSYVYPDSDYTNLQLCLQYLPHAQYCALLIEQWKITSEEAAELLRQAGWYLQIAGQYKQAEPLLRNALEIKEATLAPNDPSTAESLNNLALLYQNQGRYEEAELLFKRALAIREETLGGEHPDTATSLNNLALLYQAQGRHEEAELLQKRDLAISERMLGGEHPDTATSLHNLALLYQDQGRYEEAEPLFKRALTIREKVLGSEHPYTIQTKDSIEELHQE